MLHKQPEGFVRRVLEGVSAPITHRATPLAADSVGPFLRSACFLDGADDVHGACSMDQAANSGTPWPALWPCWFVSLTRKGHYAHFFDIPDRRRIFLIGGARRCCGGKLKAMITLTTGGARWQGIFDFATLALLSAATARGAAHAPDERQIRLHAVNSSRRARQSSETALSICRSERIGRKDRLLAAGQIVPKRSVPE